MTMHNVLHNSRKVLQIALFVLVLLALVTPVLAQDEPPVLPPAPEQDSVLDFLNGLDELIPTVASAAGLLLISVQLVKVLIERFITNKPVEGRLAAIITVVLHALIWGVWAFMKASGQEAGFDNVVKYIEGILTNLAPILLPALGVQYFTARTYRALRNDHVAGFTVRKAA